MTGIALKLCVPDFWRWTWYSEEKGMDFNGWVAKLPFGLVLIDPAYAYDKTWDEIAALGAPKLILLTNKDHERASDELRKRFDCPVAIHTEEAPILNDRPEQTFGDGDTVAGCLKVFRLKDLKSPAECSFFWPERKLLIVGDAVVGKPDGRLGLVKKHLDRPAVLESLRGLLALDFDTLLVGDGEPLPSGGKKALEALLAT